MTFHKNGLDDKERLVLILTSLPSLPPHPPVDNNTLPLLELEDHFDQHLPSIDKQRV